MDYPELILATLETIAAFVAGISILAGLAALLIAAGAAIAFALLFADKPAAPVFKPEPPFPSLPRFTGKTPKL